MSIKSDFFKVPAASAKRWTHTRVHAHARTREGGGEGGTGSERGRREENTEGGKEGVEQMDGRTGGVLGGVWEGRTAKRGSNPGSCTYNHDRIQHKFHAHQLSAEPVCAARCETKCREAPCGTHML